MTAELKLSREALARLRARANGSSLDEFLSGFLEAEMKRPSIDELLAPVRAEFEASGMSESELLELGRSELRALESESP